jgi:hypothetical protein
MPRRRLITILRPVSWNTFEQLPNPTVSYGLSPDALDQTASSSISVTYATSLTYNNHVNITGLLAYTTYYYLPQFSNATIPYTFTTARSAGDPTPYTMGVVVDMVFYTLISPLLTSTQFLTSD